MIRAEKNCPIQRDPENGRRLSVLRSDAIAHAECRRADRRTDPKFSQGQRDERVRGPKSGRFVPVGAASFATVSLDARGKRKRQYKRADYAMPYEKWRSLPEAKKYLKMGMSFARLDEVAGKMSDTKWAKKLTTARGALLWRLQERSAARSADRASVKGKGYGNGGAVEREEKHKQLSRTFHRPLEIPQTARDSHIWIRKC